MRIFPCVITFLLLLVSGFSLQGQVNRGSADYAFPTEYQLDGVYDSVFVFYAQNTDRYVEVNTPDGEEATISWERFDMGSGNYLAEGSLSSTNLRLAIDDISDFNEPFGYRFIISGSGYDDTSRCWLLLNDLDVNIINADTSEVEGQPQKVIREFQKRCNLVLDIIAGVDSTTMYYYDLVQDEAIRLNSYFLNLNLDNWSSSPEPFSDTLNEFSPNDQTYLSVTVNNPWWRDCYFIISITDTLGYTVRDSVFYESIVPYARFEVSHIRLDSTPYYPDKPDRYYEIYDYDYKYSAPAIFLFRDSSENANMYTWYFGDGNSESSSADSVLHTYLLPGTYYPYMLAENFLLNGEVCADTFPRYWERGDYPEIIIDFEEAPGVKDDLPNVFTPPYEPNKYWRFSDDVSITNFEIAIYNRNGQRVYHFAGNIRDWEGWDGSIRESGRIAPTGVYYYVVKEITALPYYTTPGDDNPRVPEDIHKEFGNGDKENNLKRGFIHLYNEE